MIWIYIEDKDDGR